jgi:hypothetical protein
VVWCAGYEMALWSAGTSDYLVKEGWIEHIQSRKATLTSIRTKVDQSQHENIGET